MIKAGLWKRSTAAVSATLIGGVVALLSMAAPAHAQTPDPPEVISPLSVEPDRNGVNLATGKLTIDMPTLSVPAAPRLKFDRVQNAAPYIVGTIDIANGADYASAAWSIHAGTDTSESFKCFDLNDCQSTTGTGSFLSASGGSALQTDGYATYRRAPGATYFFNKGHSDTEGAGIRTVQIYGSSVSYPDGEVISYTYDIGYMPGDTLGRPFYRPIEVSSNRGYYISISYQYTGSDVTQTGWGTAAEAAIYSSADPSTPIRRLTYSGTTVTEYGSPSGSRVYQISGATNALGNNVETSAGSIQLPGEGSAAQTITRHASYSIVTSVNRDDVAWTYSYTNPAQNAYGSGISYDALTVTGPNGYSMAYDVTNTGKTGGYRNLISSATDALGRTTAYAYSSETAGYRLIDITLPEGNAVHLDYDGLGNIVGKTTKPKPGSGLTNIVETAYFDETGCDFAPTAICWRPVWHRDALGRQTDFVWNSDAQLIEQTDPADQNGVRRKTIHDYADSPAGISRRTVTRTCGVGTTCGVGDETRTEVEYWGNTDLPTLVRQIDPATGETRVTTYTYDNAGRVLSVDGPLAGTDDTQYFRYDVYGRKTWEIGARGPNNLHLAKRTTYRDSDDKVTAVEMGTLTSPTDTNLIVFERSDTSYNSKRHAIRETRSAGGTTYAVTDKSFLDRGLAECTAIRMNLAALPAAGSACVAGTEGGSGPDRIVNNIYDNAGQLIQLREGVGTSIEAAEATYSYTNNGRRNYIIDANGNRAQLSYDGHDRQVKWIFPSTTRPASFNDATQATALSTAGAVNAADYEQYGYDAAGNRTSLRKRDGSTLTYSYDNLNRMIVKVVPSRSGLTAAQTRDVYYDYDLKGLMTKARFDSLSGEGITSSYNAFGELKTSQLNLGGLNRTLSYAYDLAGKRTELTQADGQKFIYKRDTLGRVSNLYEGTSQTSTYQLIASTFDNRGLIDTMERAYSIYGFTADFSFDPVGRLASLANDAPGTASDLTISQSFNPASQIASQTRSNDAYAWTGSIAVNRNYTTNGLNQYSAAGPASFTYDANGNLTSDGSTTYLYDIENRLVSATGATTAGLVYDPMGRLFQVTGPTTNTRFLYDGDELVAEYDSAGTMARRYVHSDNVDDPVVQYDGANVGASYRRFLMPDERGSIVGLFDNGGTSIAKNSYDEYGLPKPAAQGGNTGRFQYTGQIWLPELGMYHYKARIYSPTLGRFLQVDPIGYDDQVNLYAYVGNDPVNFGDPSGLDTCSTGTNAKDVESAGCRVVIGYSIEGDRKKAPPQESTGQGGQSATGMQNLDACAKDASACLQPNAPSQSPDEIIISAWRAKGLGGVKFDYDLEEFKEQIWGGYPGNRLKYYGIHGTGIRRRTVGESRVAAEPGRIFEAHTHPYWAHYRPEYGDFGHSVPVYGISPWGAWVIRPGSNKAEILIGERDINFEP